MRLLFALSAVGGALAVATPESASSPRPPMIDCGRIILTVESGAAYGDRQVVLGVVSAPERYHPQVVRTRNTRWPYWRKAGLVVRGGSPPVTVSVPRAWRNRAAITWGNSGIVHTLRIASCPAYEPQPWNAYAGGFLLRSRSACVPLVFSVRNRSKTVRFGLRQPCG